MLWGGTGKGLRGLETVRSWDCCVGSLLTDCQQGKTNRGVLSLFIVYRVFYPLFSMVFSTSPGQKVELQSRASKSGHGRQKT